MAGTDNSYNGYLSKVKGSESGGDKYAKNPRSSASGLYQFTKSTWQGLGYNWKDRFDVNLQNEAMAKLTSNNSNYLKSKLGITPTDADLYGAHFLGPQGYASVYKTSNNTPLSSVLSQGVISANPFLSGKTTGDLKNWLSKKMGSGTSTGDTQDWQQYGVDTSINLPTNTGEYQTAPDVITSKEDLEAEQAKAELLEKQREKDFLAEVQARQDQDSERRYQQEQQVPEQDYELDPSYYQVPQIELPNYEAIKYQQAQNQAQIPQDEFQIGGKKYSEQKGRLVVTTKVVNTPNGPRYYQAQSPDYNFSRELTDAKRVGDSIPKVKLDPHIIEALNRRQDGGEKDSQYKDGGSIPQRYKNMGFTHVGQKKAGDGQKKWKVLAKKGDKYKVVQGGYRGMKDFSQHGSKKRQDNFWSRMGGRDSAKANDPFSPLYWHKRLGKWEDGGEMKGEVECTNCGWSWDKSESTEKDMYNCHKCGGKSTGEAVSQYQEGGNFDPNSARDMWVAKTGMSWGEAKNLGYTDGSRESNIELLDQLRDKNFKIKSNKKMDTENTNEFFPQVPINPLWDRNLPVTKKSVTAPVRKAKKDNKTVNKLNKENRSPLSNRSGLDIFNDFITGNTGNTQNLQNGVITDKRSNTNYVVENGVVTRTFPVLTALNPDQNVNDKGVVYLDSHPESRGTPRGAYVMDPKEDIYGEPGFRINPIPAFGQPAPKAKDIALHVTYPGEFKQRNPLYTQEANKRYASYGCVNCRKPDIKYLTDRFKKGDTTIVIDSKNRKDAEFLGRKLFSRK
jgi:lipoprotein-anchoring transpeptidase ErfK/SrfK